MTYQTTDAQFSQTPGPKDSTLAIVSLVSGIVGWTIFPLIGTLVAIITGHMAKKEIRNSGGLIKGNGMANAGLILGYVQLGFVILAVCIITFLALSGDGIAEIFSNINSSLGY